MGDTIKTLRYSLLTTLVLFSFLIISAFSEKSSFNWKGDVNIGADVQSGNTDRTGASIGAEAAKRSDRNRYGLRFLHNYAEEDDNVTARNTYGAGKYDYFVSDRIFAYISVELLNDEFRNLDLRTVVGPGIGYQIWDDKVKSLLFEGGISYFSEDRKEGDNEEWATARLASIFGYSIKNSAKFTDSLIIYPNLKETGEYNMRNEAALTSALGANWSLRLANIFERSSDPPAGVEKNDSQWLLGLKYDFAL